MAQRFKAKRLISNSGVFNNEVIAPLFGHESGSYTGNAEFTQSGVEFYFVDENQNKPNYIPLQITTGNDILLNGNYNFGDYYVNFNDYDASISDRKIFGTNKLINIFNNNLDVPVSGLKPGNTVSFYNFDPLAPNEKNSKIGQYLMVDGLIGNSHNQIEITSGIYSGKSLVRLKNGPTIRNEYKKITSLESGGSKIKPHQRFLEIVYDIDVLSGKGPVRPLEFMIPVPTVSNHTVVTCIFNFQADNSPGIVSGYIPGSPNYELFTITGATYDFQQKERLIYRYGNYNPYWIRI